MDIWHWVNQKQEELADAGHERLADIMEVVPGFTVDGDHHKVDALVPEGVAYARKLDEKWVEVFLRHWHLQSLILHRKHVKGVLDEAVDLLDFSHQETTRDCPQSICTVQDLTNCYGNIDGPGYVNERLDVALETMDKIDPSWPCYTCIATEYADALNDAERYEQTLEFLDECDKALIASGEGRDTAYLLKLRVTTLINLNRYEEAAACAERLDDPYGGDTFALEAEIAKARSLAYLGKYDESLPLLPDFESIRNEQGSYVNWAEAAWLLAKNNKLANTCRLNNIFQDSINTLIEQGVIRDSITIAGQAAELALLRKQAFTALHYQQTITRLIPQLVAPLGADTLLEQITRKVTSALRDQQQALTASLPDSPETVLEHLAEDAETALAQLTTAREQWPDNPALLIEQARMLGKVHRASEKLGLLERFIQANLDSPRALLEYGFTLLDEQGSGAFRQFADSLSPDLLSEDSKLNIYWIKAHDFKRQSQTTEAKQELHNILQLTPDAYNASLMLAELERDEGNYSKALSLIERLLLQDPDDNDLHWDRIVLATLLEDWMQVRESGKQLEMKFSQESGPVDEEWGRCRIQFRENNETRIYTANRTGPVTAQIITIAHLDDTQRYADTVVFEPIPLNRLDQQDEEGYPMDSEGNYTYLYRSLKTTQPGQYLTFTLDGVHPGDEQLEQLANELENHRAFHIVRSAEEYTLTCPDSSDELPAIYAYVLIPHDSPLQALADTLASLTASYPHPLIWPDLLHELGDKDGLIRQNEIAEKYGITD